MPIYEYRCGDCGKVSSFFTKAINGPVEPVCAHCGSSAMQRRMSSFAVTRTTQSVHEKYPSASGVPPMEYYSDPRNIGRHVEEGFARYGIDMPQSVRDRIDAAREGELPKGVDV